jgi:hypothetical protein
VQAIEDAVRRYFDALARGDETAPYATGVLGEWLALNSTVVEELDERWDAELTVGRLKATVVGAGECRCRHLRCAS